MTYQNKKLSSKFHVKCKNNFYRKNNYRGKYPNENCRDNYIGETDRRIEERIILIIEVIDQGDFNYLSSFKRKISDALFIKVNDFLYIYVYTYIYIYIYIIYFIYIYIYIYNY